MITSPMDKVGRCLRKSVDNWTGGPPSAKEGKGMGAACVRVYVGMVAILYAHFSHIIVRKVSFIIVFRCLLDSSPRKMTAEQYNVLNDFAELAIRRLEDKHCPDFKVGFPRQLRKSGNPLSECVCQDSSIGSELHVLFFPPSPPTSPASLRVREAFLKPPHSSAFRVQHNCLISSNPWVNSGSTF